MRLAGAFLISVLGFLGCADPDNPLLDEAPVGDGSGDTPSEVSVGAPLTADEAAFLRFTREEEKLARDVYDALGQYGQLFANIRGSEQQHFDAIGGLLVTYGMADPAAGLPAGKFSDPVLQSLYVDLVARGAPNQLAALGVGCLIEEMDIRDLAEAIAQTTHAEVATVYQNLLKGSRNHLRSFHGRLVALGGSYTPEYIDQATFDAIVSSPRERGTD